MGLNVRQMAGFYPQLLKEALRVPPAYEVVTVMAVGYPSEPDKLPPDLQQREQAPRMRYRQARFVMNKTFDP
jgi:nitroreductase